MLLTTDVCVCVVFLITVNNYVPDAVWMQAGAIALFVFPPVCQSVVWDTMGRNIISRINIMCMS